MILTAEQAQNLVKNHNPENVKMNLVNTFINKIYVEIKKTASNGVSNIEISLTPFAYENKDYIKSVLVQQGYKVKFKSRGNSHQYDDYIQISWAT
jgi:hypothetical protein